MTSRVLEALKWIVGKLDGMGYEYEVTGGLAAVLYGSGREVADIDIEVRDGVLWRIADECNDYVVFGPIRHFDEYFDVLLMGLEYGGQLIELCGIDSMYIRGEKQEVILGEAREIEVGGMVVWVVSKPSLVGYKRLLGREVDLIDIGAIN